MVVDNNISNSQNGQDGKDDVQCGRPRVLRFLAPGYIRNAKIRTKKRWMERCIIVSRMPVPDV